MEDLFARRLEHHDSRPGDLPETVSAAPATSREHPTALPLVPAPRAAETVPHTIFFRPRKRARRLYTLLLAAALVATVVLGLAAWRERTTGSYEFAGLALGLTAILYAVRAGSATATLTVTGGSLEIHRGGSRAAFDLTDQGTRIEVVGRPGGPRWKVILRRRSLPAYVIDGSMVEPAEFMRVLRYYRTELRPGAAAG